MHAHLTSCRRSPTRSTTAPGRSRARGSCCSAMAYKADVARHARVAEPRGHAPARSPGAATSSTATRWVPELELDGVLHPSVDVDAPTRSRAADCVVHAHRAPPSSSKSPSGSTRAWSSTRGTSCPATARGVHSDLAACASSSSAPGTSAPAGRSSRSAAATRSSWPTTGTRPDRGQLARALEAAGGARRDRRHPRPRGRSTAARRRAATACSCSPRRRAARSPSASPTTPRRRTSPAPRRVAEAVAAAGGAGRSSSRSSLHVYGARLARRGRRRTRRTARRATSRTCRRSTRELALGHARPPRRRSSSRICRLGIVYGPSPVEHDAARVADRRRQVPPPRRGRASRCRSTTAAGRRSASCTSTTPRGILLDAAAAGVAATTSPPRRSRSPTSRALAEGREPRRDEPACTVASPLRVRAPPSRSTCAREAPRHRRDRLPRLARGDRCSPRRGHEVVGLARPGGAPRARGVPDVPGELDAGDPAARELVAGCDAVLHFAGIPDPARARARPGARRARERRARRSTCSTAASSTTRRSSTRRPCARRSSRRPTPTRSPSASARRPAACTPPARPSSRLTSVFGPGQVAWEGATGAIAAFAAPRARGRARSSIPGDPQRTRDFVYVDDVVAGARGARRARAGWNETLDARQRRRRPRSGAPRELVARRRRLRRRRSRRPAASCRPARTRATRRTATSPRLRLTVRPLEDAVTALCRLAPPPSRCSRPHPSAEPDRRPPRRRPLARARALPRRPATSPTTTRSQRAIAVDAPGDRAGTTRAHRRGAGDLAERRVRARRPARRRGARGHRARAPSFAAAIGSPVLTHPPLRPDRPRRSSAPAGALDEDGGRRVPALLRRRLPASAGVDAADRERAAGPAHAHGRRLPLRRSAATGATSLRGAERMPGARLHAATPPTPRCSALRGRVPVAVRARRPTTSSSSSATSRSWARPTEVAHVSDAHGPARRGAPVRRRASSTSTRSCARLGELVRTSSRRSTSPTRRARRT